VDGRKGHRRANGGFSYVDSMIRFNAPTKDFVEYVILLINNKLIRNKGKLNYSFAKRKVYIRYNSQLLLIVGSRWIEYCRETNCNLFERIIVSSLIEMNIEIDRNAPYFNGWIMK